MAAIPEVLRQRLGDWMLLRGLLIAAAAGASGACAPVTPLISNFADLDQNSRIVMVGEIHGTTETPAMFQRFVERAATRSRPINVGVELPEAALAVSCGSGASPKNPYWTKGRQDGRTSTAMWQLVCGLKKLEGRGRVTLFGLVPAAFDKGSAAHPYLAATSARLRESSRRMFLLTGNFHARLTPKTLASQLKEAGFSVTTMTASSPDAVAWACHSKGSCGPQPVKVQFCPSGTAVQLLKGPEAGFGANAPWDNCLSFPTLTSSPPAQAGQLQVATEEE